MIFLLFLGVLSAIPDTFDEQQKQAVLSNLVKGYKNAKVEYFGEHKGHGIVATQDINVGEVIVADNSTVRHVSFEKYEWSPYFEGVYDKVKVVARLLYERLVNYKEAHSNLWAHTAPSEVPIIYNWTQSEINYLDSLFNIKHRLFSPISYEKGRDLYFSCITQIPNIEVVCPLCLTEEAWIWGIGTVLSRTFSTTKATWKYMQGIKPKEGDDDIEGSTFVPALELLNHMPRPKTPNPNLGLEFTPSGYAVMRADRHFSKGDEIYWKYNFFDNIELLTYYGFVIDHNIDDRVYVYEEANGSCPENISKYTIEGKCTFGLNLYKINQVLLKYIILLTDDKEVTGDIDLENFELMNHSLREVLTKALFRYRKLNIYNSISRCKRNYLPAVKQVKKKTQSERQKLADRFCLSTYWSFFQHLKTVDSSLIEVLSKTLELR